MRKEEKDRSLLLSGCSSLWVHEISSLTATDCCWRWTVKLPVVSLSLFQPFNFECNISFIYSLVSDRCVYVWVAESRFMWNEGEEDSTEGRREWMMNKKRRDTRKTQRVFSNHLISVWLIVHCSYWYILSGKRWDTHPYHLQERSSSTTRFGIRAKLCLYLNEYKRIKNLSQKKDIWIGSERVESLIHSDLPVTSV